MQIPTIVKTQNGNVFFLQLSKFSHRYDANLQPIYHDTPTLSWHDGFDLSFEYETIIKELITLNDKSDFEVCRSESSTNFANGCAISYFDFCNWISQIDNTLEFESTQSLFDCFVTSHQIDLNDDYQHPSWLEDIFWFLDFALILASNRLNPLNKQQIEAVILQRRATY